MRPPLLRRPALLWTFVALSPNEGSLAISLPLQEPVVDFVLVCKDLGSQ